MHRLASAALRSPPACALPFFPAPPLLLPSAPHRALVRCLARRATAPAATATAAAGRPSTLIKLHGLEGAQWLPLRSAPDGLRGALVRARLLPCHAAQVELRLVRAQGEDNLPTAAEEAAATRLCPTLPLAAQLQGALAPGQRRRVWLLAGVQPPPLPPPLAFAEQRLGGEHFMVASVEHKEGMEVPFYLTPAEHAEVSRFLSEGPSRTPQMLLLVGPIKSGKSRILLDVIPRMLAARHAAVPQGAGARRRPVPLSHTFQAGAPAEAAARGLLTRLLSFAHKQGLGLGEYQGLALDSLAEVAAAVACRIHARGEELWLLLDELGAPIVASSPSGASDFMAALKSLVEQCSP